VLADAGLTIPEAPQPIHGGRVGRHPDELQELVDAMQRVCRIDPTAKW
jgi:1,2-phenylacetyl-CoA epoxidase catalytic subunit